ncbi:MAG TPA: alpha-glucuronidase family glycosyl hydrolase [Polyangia bacterium]|jgi:alpha-glucuronidase
MNKVRSSITGLCISLLVSAGGCGSSTSGQPTGSGGASNSGSGGSSSGGSSGSASGGSSGSASGGSSGSASGGSNGSGGSTGTASGGSGTASGGSGTASGGAGTASGGSGTASGGSGTASGGAQGSGGAGGAETYPKPSSPPADEDGSQLWLRYPKVPIPGRLAEYQAALTHVVKAGTSATLQAAQSELVKGLSGLTGNTIPTSDAPTGDGAVVLGTPDSSTIVKGLALSLTAAGTEGYVVQATTVDGKKAIVVAGNSDIGVLHGAFALLRNLQCHRTVQGLMLSGAPKVQHRLLNHWDNLDGTIERGYAGKSLWNWSALPGTLSQRYTDYARANASLGINGVVLNNVNADVQILTSANLDKVAALATAFRPYGIAVFLSAQFGAPRQLGNLSTADPTSSDVKQWWVTEVNTIYQKIPDFGGFLVKANSEGQPGPADYGKTHADGANMLAAALAPHNGIVMWRAFVYSDNGNDRVGQAYTEFKPLDGKFASNAMVQVKNGPLDFQPREPFHPLFGAMPGTPLALELQITKEYLGEDTHLSYLGPMWEEVLKSDTYAKGQGSTVAHVIDGSLHNYAITAMAGVAGIGSDATWMGSHFNQANWYAFGRLAWDPGQSSQDIADEWIRQTFSNDPVVVTPVTQMMMNSRQNTVNYMEPLGLVHMMGTNDHYGPAPWISNVSVANQNPVYFEKADAKGIGFDRTAKGSNVVAQYFPMVGDKFSSLATIPDDFLLFFQHVGWDDTLASSGRTIWNELVYRYSMGVDSVQTMRDQWTMVQGRIDAKRYKDVGDFLQTQHYEARWWRDACLTYFASLNGHTIPNGYAAAAMSLSVYKGLEMTCPSDATKPRCPTIYTGNPSPAITP